MAKDDERPQFNPKHRIAGAVILVSLAVIFVPMLLDETAPPAENQTVTEIPARDAAETKVVVSPVLQPGSTVAQHTTADPVPERVAADGTAADTSSKNAIVKTQ